MTMEMIYFIKPKLKQKQKERKEKQNISTKCERDLA